MEFSFSASGWLFIYQLGVAQAFRKRKLHLPPHCVRCTGSSGGSLVSACLAIDAEIEPLKDYFLDCVANVKENPLRNYFKMRDYVHGAFVLVKNNLKQHRHKIASASSRSIKTENKKSGSSNVTVRSSSDDKSENIKNAGTPTIKSSKPNPQDPEREHKNEATLKSLDESGRKHFARYNSANALDFIGPDGEFFRHESLLGGRLGVSVTTLPNCKNFVITKFDTQLEIEQAILGSCTMTPLAGMPFRLSRPDDALLHNKWVFDGGLSSIQPMTGISSRVITVAPFSTWDDKCVDIKPSEYIPIHWGLFPPSVEKMQHLYELGLADAERWLEKPENKELFTKSHEQTLQHLNLSEDLDQDKPLSEATESSETDTEEESQGEKENKTVSTVRGETTYQVVRRFKPKNVNDYRTANYADLLEQVSEAKKQCFGKKTNESDSLINRAVDRLVVFTQKRVVRSVAVCSVYGELAVSAAWNVLKGVTFAAESGRRRVIPPSGGMFSIRRWAPATTLDEAQESFAQAKKNVVGIVTLKPTELWEKYDWTEEGNTKRKRRKSIVELEVDMGGETCECEVQATLTENIDDVTSEIEQREEEDKEEGFVYRTLLHLSELER